MSRVWSRPVQSQRALEEALVGRARGFVGDWKPGSLGPGRAMTVILAHYLRTLEARLEQAPEKNALALLDLAGLGPTPPQPARAPMAIRLAQDAAPGTAPAGTAIAAPPPPGSSHPIVFETEQALGLMNARVAQVVSLWPERDQYIDHTAALAVGTVARLFARDLLRPIPHRLYLSHPTLLALAGQVDLVVEIRLAEPSPEKLAIDWRYWDGEVWRGFLDFADPPGSAGASEEASIDGTNGLRRTGAVRLRASCAQSVETAVGGAPGFWIRGELTEPLLPDAAIGAVGLPAIDTIRISTVAVRGFTTKLELREFGGAPIPAMAFMARAAAPGGMSGRVLNEALQPLGGAVVSVHLPGAADAPIAISAATGADGFFLLPIPGGAGSGRLVLRVTWADLAAEAELPDPFPQALQRAALVVSIGGLGPDKAFADATEIDLSRPFLPFGPQPQPGSTFAFTSAEVFSKPGATVRLHLPRTVGPQDVTPPEGARVMPHLLAWEYWNGRSWAPLGPSGSQAGQSPDFVCSEVVDIVVPDDMEPVKLNDVEARWMRVRIVSGGYGYVQEIRWDAGREITNSFNVTVVRPPALASASMGYTWQYGPFRPDCVLTENDMAFADRTEETTWPGQSFQPFTPSADPSPSLYLGFDAKLPLDAVSVFLDLVEDRRDPVGPALWWEFWDGFSWRRLSTDDETGRLRVPGIVSFLSAASSEPLARFGTPLHWVRARLQDSGDPGEPRLLGVYPNAVWAVERRTYRDLAIGASEGTPGQSFVIPQVPVLVGEEIEVRESTGARARTEWRLIARQLAGIDEVAIALIEDALNRASPDPDVVYPPLRLRRNAKREVAEVWVRWTSVTNLLGARPSDRVYTLDRPTGRLFFGDGHRGRIPPLDGAILARSFQTGGGSRGNLPAKAISQLLGAIAGAEEVYNLKSSEGGSDGESIAAFRRRGPMAVAHRGRAVTGRDIEALAREASAAVALARAIPLLSANGRHVPGRLTLVIVPASAEARPYPTRGLRERVHAFIAERASATLGGPEAITVVGPEYQGVDVAATLVPHRFSEAGQVERVARAAVLGFLHPLTGGPDGQGWDLGRGVYLSDLAAILDRVPGLDAAFDIALLAGGVPQGEAVAMAPERIAAAGTISLYLLGREA